MAKRSRRPKDDKTQSETFQGKSGSRPRTGKLGFKLDDKGHSYEKDSAMDSANDISWWNHNPDLTRSAGNLSFNNPLGAPINLGNGSAPITVPGIMRLNFAPAIGVSTRQTDVVNVAANNIYSWVRHANSGHANYEAPDYMMFLLSVDTAYMFHAWMCRVYGIANTYSITNRYIPKSLLTALGVDADDVVSNLADLLFLINNFAVRVGSIAIPNSFDYYKRHRFLVSHVFADAGNDKAQLYLYNPQYYFEYSPKTSTTGSELVTKLWNNSSDGSFPISTISEMSAFANHIVDVLMSDEDIGIMSGDTLKAFGADNLIQLPIIPQDFTVMPDYNVEVLGQIHNTTFLGDLEFGPVGSGYNNVTQADGVIKYQPYIGTTAYDYQKAVSKRLLNSYDDAPTPEQVMEFTRNMFIVGDRGSYVSGSNTVYYYKVLTAGTEIFTSPVIYYFSSTGALTSVGYNTGLFLGNTVSVSQFDYAKLTQFDWAPMAFLFNNPNNTTSNLTHIVGDVRNYTIVEIDTLSKLHDTAVISAFSVEQVGRTTL